MTNSRLAKAAEGMPRAEFSWSQPHMDMDEQKSNRSAAILGEKTLTGKYRISLQTSNDGTGCVYYCLCATFPRGRTAPTYYSGRYCGPRGEGWTRDAFKNHAEVRNGSPGWF